eukprot:scaffold13252_cov118-Skeletonema_menzelii.AAC.2
METKVDDSAHASLLKANQDHFDEQATKWDDDPEYIKVSRESYSTIMHHLGRFLFSSPPSSSSSSREVDHPTTNVLNFGCGTGLLEAQLRFNVTSITGVDISKGMIDRMRHKIQEESWSNVTALQMDILDNAQTTLLPMEGFDMIISCYTFHHLQDVTAIGRALLKYLKPDGYFCIIDFAAAAAAANAEHTEHHHEHHDHQEVHEHQKRYHAGDKLSEAAKASIGTHDGFSKSFLIDYYQTVLGLENVIVEDATPLYYDGMEYPTIVAYGRRRSGGK